MKALKGRFSVPLYAWNGMEGNHTAVVIQRKKRDWPKEPWGRARSSDGTPQENLRNVGLREQPTCMQLPVRHRMAHLRRCEVVEHERVRFSCTTSVVRRDRYVDYATSARESRAKRMRSKIGLECG